MAIEWSRPDWAGRRAADPPGPATRDWWLVAAVAAVAVVEAATRGQLVWPATSLAVTVGTACLLPWRRVRPLAVFLASFGTVSVVQALSLVLDAGWQGLDASAFMLVLPYALARWASAREVGIGAAAMALPLALSGIAGDPKGDVLGGALVVLLSFAIGLAVRSSAELRAEEVAGLRSRERSELARELHDTVAHHVSAIAVQAQAGRVVAATRPDAALEVLGVIEEEAARALEEMRSMVGALREGDPADLRPQQGIRDLPGLERRGGIAGPQVVVAIADGLDDVRPSVDAACFRLVQEAVTNALRHARHASLVQVSVDGDEDHVRLTVVDDGRGSVAGAAAPGFGLVGMAERAKLLGGTFDAGPRPDGGWAVEATLPRRAVAT
ncbi:MAG: sensor histidine kinase [Acidimicrobiales bacterium]